MPLPSLPCRRSSRLSQQSPRTPSLGSPAQSTFFLPSSSNRKSSDSWNSSNCDEEIDWEWKPEQILLLSRTLDALPSHILTPFVGAVPPSNLLDKIARGVFNAKDAHEWPHSMRATRAKVVELARARAKDGQNTIDEEEDDCPGGLRESTNVGPPPRKRPLYRQSSMDFLQSAMLDQRDDPFGRASARLERGERVFPNPAYHHPLTPSTPSSTTLRSTTTSNSRSTRPTSQSSLRSLSTLSSASSYSCLPPVRRTDSFGPNTRQPLKRAPSFGAASQAKRNSAALSFSSDEEDAIRNSSAKKARKTVAQSTPSSDRKTRSATTRPARMNVRRNPSILGDKLPCTSPTIPEMEPPETSNPLPTPEFVRPAPRSQMNNPHPYLRVQIPSLDSPPRRPLRRVATRRISFNANGGGNAAEAGLLEPVEIFAGIGIESGLGSAFQLR